MRVTTALNNLLALPGASVTDVRLTAEGVIVTVGLRRRRMACSVCGQVYAGMHDHGRRRWRHLDLAGYRCFVQCELRRVACRDCGVRVEAVPWARPGARHTREFEAAGRVLRAADGQEPGPGAAAGGVGDGRADRHPGGGRPAR